MASEWETVELGTVATVVMGQSPPGSTYNEKGDGLPFFQGVKDFGDRHPSVRVYCSAPSRIARPGDILFSVRAPIGRVNVAVDTCAFGRGLAVIRPHDAADARYIELILRHIEEAWSALEGGGSVFGNATRRDLESLAIPWANDPAERHAIAHILGTLDDKIELNRRMARTLEEMARALFKAWFVDFEPVRAKMDGRWRPGESLPGLPAHLYDLFPDRLVDSELGEIPEGWEVRPVGRLADVVGGTTPSTKVAAYWEGGTHCWATPKDLAGLPHPVLLGTDRHVTDSGLSKTGSGLLPAGTVLLSSRAPIGYLAVAEVPVAINQGFIAMRPKQGIASVFLLMWAEIANDEIMSRANGSTFLEISKGSFRPIPVVVPSESAMRSFEKHAGGYYRRIVECVRQTHVLTEMRNALLPRLVSGKVRVKDPDRILMEAGRSDA